MSQVAQDTINSTKTGCTVGTYNQPLGNGVTHVMAMYFSFFSEVYNFCRHVIFTIPPFA